jgi:hypothetical protein
MQSAVVIWALLSNLVVLAESVSPGSDTVVDAADKILEMTPPGRPSRRIGADASGRFTTQDRPLIQFREMLTVPTLMTYLGQTIRR